LANPEIAFLALTLIGFALGCWAIAWARTSRRSTRVLLGRLLFVLTLFFVASAGVVAALDYAEGLIPLGLLSGFLVMGMLCEIPHPAWHD
jgi:hypothetical protein